jgi:Undecaprenyl pyrophosphate synthase
VQRLLADGVAAEALTEDLFASYLHTAGEPDPDLIIRTAGEMRLSNFLLWQAAYAEYYCTQTHWPDFGKGRVLPSPLRVWPAPAAVRPRLSPWRSRLKPIFRHARPGGSPRRAP